MTRWNRRLLFGAMAVLVPVLAGCEAGFDAPTLEFHPAAVGVSTVHNGISIDNAFVLGPPVGTELPPGGQAGSSSRSRRRTATGCSRSARRAPRPR